MAEQTTSKVQKGWLKTREGNKFAPGTLIENVYDRNGVDYDTAIKKYIAENSNSLSTSLTGLSQTVESHTSQISDLQNQDSALAAQDAALAARLSNFDGSNSDVLYIVDNSSRIIAKIDANGVTSIDFTIPGETSLSAVDDEIDNLRTSIINLASKIDNINADDSNTLYIVDNEQRIIAKIDAEGVHSINFLLADGTDFNTIASTVERIDDSEEYKSFGDVEAELGRLDTEVDKKALQSDVSTLTSRVNGHDTAIAGNVQEINKIKANFNSSDSDTLYIVDGQDRIIAKINNQGITTTDVILSDTDESTLDISVLTKINSIATDIYNAVQDAKSELRGTATADYDTLGKTETKIGELGTALSNLKTSHEQLEQDVGNVSNIMNFLGVSTTDPNTAVTIGGVTIATADLANGDVVIYGNKEYVYVTSDSKWHEYGDATGNAAAISTLESWRTNTVDPTLLSHTSSIGSLSTSVGDLQTKTASLDASEGSDAFYIVDAQNRKICEINSQGIISVNMIARAVDTTDASKLLYSYNIKDLGEQLETTKNQVNTIDGDQSTEGSFRKAIYEAVQALRGDSATQNLTVTSVESGLNALETAMADKVDKEEGKGLSTNDFDNDYKEKLYQVEYVPDYENIAHRPIFNLAANTVFYNGSVTASQDGSVLMSDIEARRTSSTDYWVAGNSYTIVLNGQSYNFVYGEGVDMSAGATVVLHPPETAEKQLWLGNLVLDRDDDSNITKAILWYEQLGYTIIDTSIAVGDTVTLQISCQSDIVRKISSDCIVMDEELSAISTNPVQNKVVHGAISNIETKTKNINAEDGTNTLYIVDNSNRVVAKINEYGISTIDIALPNNNLTLINNGIFFDEATDIEINF